MRTLDLNVRNGVCVGIVKSVTVEWFFPTPEFNMREQNIKNLKTEKLGITVLRNLLNGFDVPNKLQLKKLYDILNIDYKKYSRSVDGVLLNDNSFEDVKSKEDLTLIEIKTTSSKSVKELPYGVFLDLQKMKKTYLNLLIIIDCV